ncbi:MAG: hypothetical protein HY577_02670 [Candidatus Nealsonbacteria bacterium]|nr:hypothetical protein [Candidatus Nealsonbacteria bacterium]
MSEAKKTLSKRIGYPDYVDENCWLATTLGYPPAKRCWYCELRFRHCPFTQYLGVSLALTLISFLVLYLSRNTITRAEVFVVFILVLSYGYFSTRSTEKIIEANFAERKTRIALEEAKASLEGKIGQRTKDLQAMTQSLEEEVQVRTRELQEKVEELEKINKLAVDRELRMVELKEKIKELEKGTGEDK